MNDRRFQAACAAMQGLLACEDFNGSPEDVAEWAVRNADALLARLAETEPKQVKTVCSCGHHYWVDEVKP